jgi:hypothetical protein
MPAVAFHLCTGVLKSCPPSMMKAAVLLLCASALFAGVLTLALGIEPKAV